MGLLVCIEEKEETKTTCISKNLWQKYFLRPTDSEVKLLQMTNHTLVYCMLVAILIPQIICSDPPCE